MKLFHKMQSRLFIFGLCIFLLGAAGIVSAEQIIVEMNLKSIKQIQESTIVDKKVIPLYSFEKVDDNYKVIYRSQTEEELKREKELLDAKPISYEKEVKNYHYESLSSIPENIDYSEYSNEHESMFSGELELQSIEVYEIYNNRQYLAEYKGLITNK